MHVNLVGSSIADDARDHRRGAGAHELLRRPPRVDASTSRATTCSPCARARSTRTHIARRARRGARGHGAGAHERRTRSPCFKSLGLAVEDLAAAELAIAQRRDRRHRNGGPLVTARSRSTTSTRARGARRHRGAHAARPPRSADAPAEIYLKLENLQPIGSFKIRGAFNAMSQALARGARGRRDHGERGQHGPGRRLGARAARHPVHRRRARPRPEDEDRGDRAARRPRASRCRSPTGGRRSRTSQLPGARRRLHPPGARRRRDGGQRDDRPRAARGPARPRRRRGPLGRRRAHLRHRERAARAQARRARSTRSSPRRARRWPRRSPRASRTRVELPARRSSTARAARRCCPRCGSSAAG